MNTVGLGNVSSTESFTLKKGVTQAKFEEKVESSLSTNTLTKEGYKKIKDSISDGRTNLNDILRKVGEPSGDIKAAFAKGKNGSITLSDAQVVEIKKLLSSGAQENNGSPVLKSFKAIDISRLGQGNVSSLKKEFSLSAGFTVGASTKDLGLIGINGDLKVGAKTTGIVKVSAEQEKDGKVTLTFDTTLKGGIDAKAKLDALIAKYGAGAKGEVGYQIRKSYTFNNKEDALKFLQDGGVGLNKTATPATKPMNKNEVQIREKSEPVLLGELNTTVTRIVKKTSNSGALNSMGIKTDHSLSSQKYKVEGLKSPSYSETRTTLETGKGDKSNTTIKIFQRKDENGQKTPAQGNIDVSVSFAKIGRAKEEDLKPVIKKIADRLESVINKSNTASGTTIKADRAEIERKVADSLKSLQQNFGDMTHGQSAASTFSLPVPVVKSTLKVGSVLNLRFDLESTHDGNLSFAKTAPALQLKSEKAFSLGAMVSLPMLPGSSVGGKVDASVKKERTFEPANNAKANAILGRGWKEDGAILGLANKEKNINGIVHSEVNTAYKGQLDEQAQGFLSSAKSAFNRIGDFFG